MKYSVLLLAILLVACNKTDKAPVSVITPNKSENAIKSQSLDSVVYVTNRKGTDIKDEPNEGATTVGHYKYGDRLEVKAIYSGWLKIWENNYIRQTDVGNISKIKLYPEDVAILSSLTVDGNSTIYNVDKGEKISKYLTITLVDQKTYEAKKATAVEFISGEPSVKKMDGKISLECDNGIKILEDDLDDSSDTYHQYRYAGYIPFLNSYVIEGQYWEWGDYRFYSKINGEIIAEFIDYPYISPDKKYIFAVNANPYEDLTGDFELCKIEQDTIKHIAQGSFKYWMPVDEPRIGFWSSDGDLYIAVNHTGAYWRPDGNYNQKHQYIRIHITE